MSDHKTTNNISELDRTKMLYEGALIHAKKILAERLERSRSITGALRDDTQKWELESVMYEIEKWEHVVRTTQLLIVLMR